MQDRLLEELAVMLDCYISSLPSRPLQALERLRRLDPREYTLPEWAYCLGYLFRQRVDLKDYPDLEIYLREKWDQANLYHGE